MELAEAEALEVIQANPEVVAVSAEMVEILEAAVLALSMEARGAAEMEPMALFV